ncbi:ABC transporter permease [Pseudaestuariivita rosea]|uniref:ABC transporter permease n=1 Tax=Pseudaestuariivita rosea TaxID=2763263 RepID=UPI001ABAAE75|nr:ABC transporter permease [Pseudaestuariivita rosea]
MSETTAQGAEQSKWARIDWKMLGPVAALVALLILGSFLNENFLSAGNLLNILTRSAFIGIIAIGATFVISSGGIDLSVGSMAAFTAGVMIMLMNWMLGMTDMIWLIVMVGVLAGAFIGTTAGWINGILITRGGIEAFIVTLGTMGIYRSLVTYLADGGTLSLDREVRALYRPVYYGDVLGLPIPVLLFALAAVIGWVVLNNTAFGRHVQSVGANEDVARYSAINTNRIKVYAFMIQGACVALATIVYVPRLGSASATTGVLWELEAIAAVIIGGTLLKGGYGRIGGTIAGALILTLIGNILNLTDLISNYLNGAVQGVIIIAAVFLQRGLGRKS